VAFDLDPGTGIDTLDCAWGALELKKVVEGLGLECFPKTSGGKGIHVYIPLNTKVTFDDTKAFAKGVAMLLERTNRGKVTSNMRKVMRRGKIFIDWSQNDRHKTTVCAYSLRARSRPTVSTPLEWDELTRARKKRDPDTLVFVAEDVLKRIEKKGDLFEPVLKLKQKLPAPPA
jgi:bifunctional non-homologous end joining protein LigD